MKRAQSTIPILILMSTLVALSPAGFANDKNPKKTWKADNSDNFLKLCIVAAVNKNMKHLVNKKIVTLDSDKYKSLLKKVRQYHTKVCSCTQDSIKENKTFMNIAKKCNQQALASEKNKS